MMRVSAELIWEEVELLIEHWASLVRNSVNAHCRNDVPYSTEDCLRRLNECMALRQALAEKFKAAEEEKARANPQ